MKCCGVCFADKLKSGALCRIAAAYKSVLPSAALRTARPVVVPYEPKTVCPRRGGYQPPANDWAASNRAADSRPYGASLEVRS